MGWEGDDKRKPQAFLFNHEVGRTSIIPSFYTDVSLPASLSVTSLVVPDIREPRPSPEPV
jgi:hypothetical protein